MGFRFGVSHHNASLLGTLYITLVVASDAIPDSNKVETFVKDVIVSSCNLKQTFSEAVIEVLLLSSVV
jgi:hypothetical protein